MGIFSVNKMVPKLPYQSLFFSFSSRSGEAAGQEVWKGLWESSVRGDAGRSDDWRRAVIGDSWT